MQVGPGMIDAEYNMAGQVLKVKIGGASEAKLRAVWMLDPGPWRPKLNSILMGARLV